ncbi:hypothetical protein C8R44DRAFT_858921 [Mycena epipterygia]|nr:hypothetical protein C8R44DRAFT_858921 [Mycena epipterygia]
MLLSRPEHDANGTEVGGYFAKSTVHRNIHGGATSAGGLGNPHDHYGFGMLCMCCLIRVQMGLVYLQIVDVSNALKGSMGTHTGAKHLRRYMRNCLSTAAMEDSLVKYKQREMSGPGTTYVETVKPTFVRSEFNSTWTWGKVRRKLALDWPPLELRHNNPKSDSCIGSRAGRQIPHLEPSGRLETTPLRFLRAWESLDCTSDLLGLYGICEAIPNISFCGALRPSRTVTCNVLRRERERCGSTLEPRKRRQWTGRANHAGAKQPTSPFITLEVSEPSLPLHRIEASPWMTLDTHGKHPGISIGINISIPGVYSVIAILDFLGALWDLRCLNKLKQRGVTRERQCYSAAGGTPEYDGRSDASAASSLGTRAVRLDCVPWAWLPFLGQEGWGPIPQSPSELKADFRISATSDGEVTTEVAYGRKSLASLGSDSEGKEE